MKRIFASFFALISIFAVFKAFVGYTNVQSDEVLEKEFNTKASVLLSIAGSEQNYNLIGKMKVKRLSDENTDVIKTEITTLELENIDQDKQGDFRVFLNSNVDPSYGVITSEDSKKVFVSDENNQQDENQLPDLVSYFNIYVKVELLNDDPTPTEETDTIEETKSDLTEKAPVTLINTEPLHLELLAQEVQNDRLSEESIFQGENPVNLYLVTDDEKPIGTLRVISLSVEPSLLDVFTTPSIKI